MLVSDLRNYIIDSPELLSSNPLLEVLKDQIINGETVETVFVSKKEKVFIKILPASLSVSHFKSLENISSGLSWDSEKITEKLAVVSPFIPGWAKDKLKKMNILPVEIVTLPEKYVTKSDASIRITKSSDENDEPARYWIISADRKSQDGHRDQSQGWYDAEKEAKSETDEERVSWFDMPLSFEKKQFGKLAKPGDFTISIMRMSSSVLVFPPEEIIRIRKSGRSKTYFLRYRKNAGLNGISFEEFKDLMKKKNIELTLSENSIRGINQNIFNKMSEIFHEYEY